MVFVAKRNLLTLDSDLARYKIRRNVKISIVGNSIEYLLSNGTNCFRDPCRYWNG
jgi:hypothetical protein